MFAHQGQTEGRKMNSVTWLPFYRLEDIGFINVVGWARRIYFTVGWDRCSLCLSLMDNALTTAFVKYTMADVE